MMVELIERLSAEDDLSKFYTSLSLALNDSSLEPQADENLIEHQTAHNVLRHLIIADEKRQNLSEQMSTLVSTILSLVSPENLRTWILCNRGCFVFVLMLEHSKTEESQQIRTLLVPSAVETLKRQTFTGAKLLVEKLLSTEKQ